MINIKNKILLSVAVVSLAGSSLFGAAHTFAQTSQTESTSLVQKIASKFGLNQSEVQAVFDGHRGEHHAQMQAQFETKLTKLVADGKITEEQKKKILDKFNGMKDQREVNREEMQNMTPEERRTARDKRHEEMKAWAEANGIDLEVLTGAFGQGKGMGKHGWK